MGVDVKMVTGDHEAIAAEIAGKLGLGCKILVAQDVFAKDRPDPDAASVEAAEGFARVFPEHKFKIVKILQGAGHIVGMTGDGVNDAPALKQTDVGIAVSGATDAARAAADLVLTAPGLSVITRAIEGARARWDMTRVLTIATALGVYGVIESFVLCWLVRDYFGLAQPVVQALIFLKLLVSGHMTIYLTRNVGSVWERPWVPAEATQVVGTLVVVYGFFMSPTGWPLALLVWAYTLVSFFVASAVKIGSITCSRTAQGGRPAISRASRARCWIITIASRRAKGAKNEAGAGCDRRLGSRRPGGRLRGRSRKAREGGPPDRQRHRRLRTARRRLRPEAHTLAERLAKLTGEMLTEAVTTALREPLARIENVGAVDEERFRKLSALVEGSRRLWREPYLSMDHGTSATCRNDCST